jgi:hypothetical protein
VSECTLKVPPSSKLPLSISAVFAAEGFSKWMMADFEGPVSVRSIFEILPQKEKKSWSCCSVVEEEIPETLTL